MRKRSIQAAFDPLIEEEEQVKDESLQRVKNVFQRYRNARCPIKKVHPQSVTSLSKSQMGRMLPVLDKYGDDATIRGMERFCEEEFWLSKGLPLNAFYKFTDRWIAVAEETYTGEAEELPPVYGLCEVSKPKVNRMGVRAKLEDCIRRAGTNDKQRSYYSDALETVKDKSTSDEEVLKYEKEANEYLCQ
jgi:hypothetical protein